MSAPISISVSMDPGSTEYLFTTSLDRTKKSFQEVFPEAEFERELAVHSPIAGTTLSIVIGGLTVGAGIVGAELLKEASKDLWKAIKTLCKPRKKHSDGRDHLNVTIQLNNLKFTGTLEGIGEGSQTDVEHFLIDGLTSLYARAESISQGRGLPENPEFRLPLESKEVIFSLEKQAWHLAGPLCPNCVHLSADPMQEPCFNCEYRGAKLGFEHEGVRYGPDGRARNWRMGRIRADGSFEPDPHVPHESFYQPRYPKI
jgi:hypothetical protein